MDASPSKPSVSRSSTPLSEPCSPSTASVLAKETRDGARLSSGVLACIPPSEAAGPLRKKLRSALPEDGGDAKRIKDVGNAVVPHTAEPESLLFSCQPSGASRDRVLGPSSSVHGVQPMSSFELDGAKHKIFLSHSGAQKDFVEQLCVDLERMGYCFPFFDKRHHSLPKGEEFASLIIKAARMCHVAVIVLSEEFLCSKWPMIELAEFYVAQQDAAGGGGKLKLLPLFFKLSIEEVRDEGHWMPKWKEHAASDGRIDLSKWSAAVKALCKSNGLEFGEVARKEVPYRKWVVESIFKLSPPDILFGSSKSMVGSGRMCEEMSRQFVEDTIVGARVLGVYGMAGLGKTTLVKALHDCFYGEFLGKVCYVDMRYGSRAQRQKWMLKMLCGFEKDVVACIGANVEKGLMPLKTFMKQHPVCLVLDNITFDKHVLQEVQDYLRLGFHRESKILITASSEAILEDLLPNMQFYTPMPTLMVEEARELFLKCAAPMKSLSELTSEEQNILGICIRKCWFHSEGFGFYHPMALRALADFLGSDRRVTLRVLAKENLLWVWKDRLEEKGLVKTILKSSEDLFGILGMQFSTFDLIKKLVFLDLALYQPSHIWSKVPCFDEVVERLCRLHDKTPEIIERKLLELRKSDMINFSLGGVGWITMPTLYYKFAKWYATDHCVNGLKTSWGVFELGGMNSIKSWSNLIRLRISPMTFANARLVASKRMQELINLVVLQLSCCQDLTMLNLEGLKCLRDLELRDLPNLKTITLSGNSSKDEYAGIYDSLQYVRLAYLESLFEMPDLRPCTSLHSISLGSFEEVGNLEGVDCLAMKVLILKELSPTHFEQILNFNCLQSLEELRIDAESETEFFNAHWKRRVDESDISLDCFLEGEEPCAKFLEELCLLLYGSNNMICTYFDPVWCYPREDESSEDESSEEI